MLLTFPNVSKYSLRSSSELSELRPPTKMRFTYTQTDTQTDREREREREMILQQSIITLQKYQVEHTIHKQDQQTAILRPKMVAFQSGRSGKPDKLATIFDTR